MVPLLYPSPYIILSKNSITIYQITNVSNLAVIPDPSLHYYILYPHSINYSQFSLKNVSWMYLLYTISTIITLIHLIVQVIIISLSRIIVSTYWSSPISSTSRMSQSLCPPLHQCEPTQSLTWDVGISNHLARLLMSILNYLQFMIYKAAKVRGFVFFLKHRSGYNI